MRRHGRAMGRKVAHGCKFDIDGALLKNVLAQLAFCNLLRCLIHFFFFTMQNFVHNLQRVDERQMQNGMFCLKQ
jgi:hypothetical protein